MTFLAFDVKVFLSLLGALPLLGLLCVRLCVTVQSQIAKETPESRATPLWLN